MKPKMSRKERGKLGAKKRWAKPIELPKRFWAKVEILGPNDCWPWRGGFRGKYGQIKVNGKKVGAHRVAYALDSRLSPEGFKVCHTCDNPPCCNPKHLFRGTSKDNAQDAVKKGRWNPGHKGGSRGKGELSNRRKLTQKEVDQIRRAAARGILTQAAIGRKFGVGQDEVSRIVHHKRW